MFMLQTSNEKSDTGAGDVESKVATGKVGESFSALYESIFDKTTTFSDALQKQFEAMFSPKSLYERSAFLDQEQADLRASLGLGSQKADEFRKLVADGAANFAAIGLSVDKVGSTYEELVSVFQTNLAVSNEDLTEIAATAKVTGQSAKELSENFRGVGISIQEMGERMVEVAQIAREAGVSVAAVSAGVIKNLDKMNIYNFENGTKGLAKMAAQASRLGIDMDKIFAVVDKAFNPESAIEMAAAMQRLGVSTGALLDPLRLMDLSQNDPTELQNQIVNMTKDFVRFNEELGQFEIMPGEKRRLQEIGKELGMSNGELQKMAINAAGLEMKMKQIRFPSSLASKEDRELIATLATVNKQGVAEIKVATLDEKGERTGEYEMVEVSELTNEQLEGIKKDQELRGKTMEEIAGDQLSELNKLNTQFDTLKKAIAYGVSSSDPIQGAYGLMTDKLRRTVFGGFAPTEEGGENEQGFVRTPYKKTRVYREGINEQGLGDIKELGTAVYNDVSGLISGAVTKAGELFENFELPELDLGISGMFDTIKNKLSEYTNLLPDFSDLFTGGADPNNVSETNIRNKSINNSVTNTNLTQSMGKIDFSTLDINEKIDVDINVKLDPNVQNQALSDIIQRQVEEWFKGGNSNNNLSIVHNRLKMYRENNGLTPQ
jgi:hypothetical protein